jgi:hypothetical protein
MCLYQSATGEKPKNPGQRLSQTLTGSSHLRSASSKPGIGLYRATVSYLATIPSKRAPAFDQLRVLMGGSFRAAERFSLPRFHKTVIQLTASDPHC